MSDQSISSRNLWAVLLYRRPTFEAEQSWPELEEIPLIYQPDIYPLLSMNDIELQQEMERVFPVAQWVEYETLLTKKKMEILTPKEQKHLDALRHEADVLTLRKAYAAVLLKRRGHTLLVLEDLRYLE